MKIKSKKLLILSTLTSLTSISAITLVACTNDNGSGNGNGGGVVTPPSNDQPGKVDPNKDQPVTSNPEDDKQVVIREMPSILDDKLTLNLVPLIKYIKGIENLKALDGDGNETDKLISPEEMLAKYQELSKKFEIDMLRFWDGKAETVNDYGFYSILRKIKTTKFWGNPQIKDEKEIYSAYSALRSLEGYVFRFEDVEDSLTKTTLQAPTKIWEDSLSRAQTVAFDGDKKSIATIAEIFIAPAMAYVYAENVINFMKAYIDFKIDLLNARTSNLSFKDYFKDKNNKARNALANAINEYNKFLNLKEGQYMRSTKELFMGHGETYYKLLLEINNNELAPFAKAIEEQLYVPTLSGANSYETLALAKTLFKEKFKADPYSVNDVLDKISKTETENRDSLITYYKTRFNWMFKTSSEELAAKEGNN
ncbi:hypothetical protein ACA758_00180 [Mycoplasmopsis agassizii]|uniref:hypothetical protein n=1 Tax=Mycoplasmopsis agassizii TaxID=33922 RepID=UPI003529744B